jgi:hypothetical protein
MKRTEKGNTHFAKPTTFDDWTSSVINAMERCADHISQPLTENITLIISRVQYVRLCLVRKTATMSMMDKSIATTIIQPSLHSGATVAKRQS